MNYFLSETAPFGIRAPVTNGIACLMCFWTFAGALSNCFSLSTTSRDRALSIVLMDVMMASWLHGTETGLSSYTSYS